jgi:hypothetical protein
VRLSNITSVPLGDCLQTSRRYCHRSSLILPADNSLLPSNLSEIGINYQHTSPNRKKLAI